MQIIQAPIAEIPPNPTSVFLTLHHHDPHGSLVDDVLGHNAGDKVPMEKVVMLLWAFRDDPSVVKFMAQFVSKVSTLELTPYARILPVMAKASILQY